LKAAFGMALSVLNPAVQAKRAMHRMSLRLFSGERSVFVLAFDVGSNCVIDGASLFEPAAFLLGSRRNFFWGGDFLPIAY
jgi:hypothetical protein